MKKYALYVYMEFDDAESLKKAYEKEVDNWGKGKIVPIKILKVSVDISEEE